MISKHTSDTAQEQVHRLFMALAKVPVRVCRELRRRSLAQGSERDTQHTPAVQQKGEFLTRDEIRQHRVAIIAAKDAKEAQQGLLAISHSLCLLEITMWQNPADCDAGTSIGTVLAAEIVEQILEDKTEETKHQYHCPQWTGANFQDISLELYEHKVS